MLQHIRPAVVLLILFSALTGLLYPLAVTGVAQLALTAQANGSLIEKDGVVIGSALIGQNFKSDRYFHPRPSATTDTDPNDSTKTIDAPYNAANSSGSNLGADVAEAGRPGQGVDRSVARQGRRRAGSGRRRDDLGLRARSRHFSAECACAGAVGGQGARPRRSARARPGGSLDRAAGVRLDRTTAGQRFAAEFGAGSDKVVVVTTRGS